jgi:hypothetical protein
VVQDKGRGGFMPGDLPASCPCNFRLIAHRLRVGLSPHMAYEPDQYQEGNRESVGKQFAGACQHLDQVEAVGHVFQEGGEWQLPAGASAWALGANVREKHERKAREAGWPAKGEPPKTRIFTDATSCGLNDSFSRWPFRYDGVDSAVRLMTPGCYMVCLDLRKYFNMLPWTREFSEKWAWFKDPRRDGGVWQFDGHPPGRRWWPHKDAGKPPWRRYNTCSFGTSPVPAWASTVSAVIAQILKASGVSGVTFYIDDFFLCCRTKAECAARQRQVEQVIRGLGLVVADEKTVEPTQQCEYLGLLLDSVAMEVTITEKRKRSLLAMIGGMLDRGHATRKSMHELQGKLSWVGMIVRGGRVFLRGIINAVTRTRRLRRNKVQIDIDDELEEDLRWWQARLLDMEAQGSRLWLTEADYTVLTTKSDASGHLGWGLVIGDTIHWSKWSPPEVLDNDMVLKELTPILYMCETMGEQLRGKIVRVGMDNAGAVFDVLKGDTPTAKSRRLLKRIAHAQAEFNFDLLAVHVDREKNKLSDVLTRFIVLDEVQAELPDGWRVGDEASVATSPWRLSPDSLKVSTMRLERRTSPRATQRRGSGTSPSSAISACYARRKDGQFDSTTRSSQRGVASGACGSASGRSPTTSRLSQLWRTK